MAAVGASGPSKAGRAVQSALLSASASGTGLGVGPTVLSASGAGLGAGPAAVSGSGAGSAVVSASGEGRGVESAVVSASGAGRGVTESSSVVLESLVVSRGRAVGSTATCTSGPAAVAPPAAARGPLGVSVSTESAHSHGTCYTSRQSQSSSTANQHVCILFKRPDRPQVIVKLTGSLNPITR